MKNGPVSNVPGALPPILAGQFTQEVKQRVEQFYNSAAAVFETWVVRWQSKHMQRACREDIMAFVNFARIRWREDCAQLLQVSVTDVLAFRDRIREDDATPKPSAAA